MWKEVQRTRKKEVLSSHHVESSRPSLTTVSLEVLCHHSATKVAHQLKLGNNDIYYPEHFFVVAEHNEKKVN